MHKYLHYIWRVAALCAVGGCAVALLTTAARGQSTEDTTLALPYHTYDRPVVAETYLIRPLEKLIVYFVGTKLAPLSLLVNADGKLVDPSLGVFELAGKTLAEAREMIAPSIRKAYTASAFEITVGGPYRVAINVTGAVAQPGIYFGYTSNYVSELINLAGGLLGTASRRHVQFLGGPQAVPVDLDRAQLGGDWTADPCLYAGYRVHIPRRSEQTVHVVGQVAQPREVEILPGDTLGVILEFAGGPTAEADLSRIYFSGDSTAAQSLGSSVAAGTVVIVPERGSSSGAPGSVAVFGAVATPGLFPLTSGARLADMLAGAGGLTQSANRSRLTVFRRVSGEARLPSSHDRFPIMVGGTADAEHFVLRNGDSVFVPYTVGFVEVTGRVRFPGLFPFVDGKDASYYIGIAGGFLADADRQEFDITDRISRRTNSGGPGSRVGDGDLLTIRMKDPAP